LLFLPLRTLFCCSASVLCAFVLSFRIVCDTDNRTASRPRRRQKQSRRARTKKVSTSRRKTTRLVCDFSLWLSCSAMLPVLRLFVWLAGWPLLEIYWLLFVRRKLCKPRSGSNRCCTFTARTAPCPASTSRRSAYSTRRVSWRPSLANLLSVPPCCCILRRCRPVYCSFFESFCLSLSSRLLFVFRTVCLSLSLSLCLMI